jgi:hypothetical protein
VGLRSELATAIIAAAATIIVSLLSVMASKFYERRDNVERESRTKKIPVYEQATALIFTIIHQGKPGYPTITSDETLRRYSELTQGVIVWGSDGVLKAFGEFRVASLQIKEKGVAPLLVSIEDLMLAVRKDLGYKNSGLRRGDVLRLFINDLEQQGATLPPLRGKSR